MNALCLPTKLAWFAALTLTFAAASSAQSSSVYVAYNGSDSNPCTRPAPCQTITHALTVVPAGGVVDIIASGSYDIFTVTQAVTVEANPGLTVLIPVPSNTTGIQISAGASDSVKLKNLSLWTTGTTVTDLNSIGILENSAGELIVENCAARGFQIGLAVYLGGILKVIGGYYEGMNISSSLATIDGVTARPGAFFGDAISVEGTVTISHSVLLGGPGALRGIDGAGGSVLLENNVISGFSYGVALGTYYCPDGFLSDNTISNNGIGIYFDPDNLYDCLSPAYSRGNNTIVANGTNVSGGSLTPIPGQ
jgi:hypothetical protein